MIEGEFDVPTSSLATIAIFVFRVSFCFDAH